MSIISVIASFFPSLSGLENSTTRINVYNAKNSKFSYKLVTANCALVKKIILGAHDGYAYLLEQVVPPAVDTVANMAMKNFGMVVFEHCKYM